LVVDGEESIGQIRWGVEWEEVFVVVLGSGWGERVLPVVERGLPVVEHVASVGGREGAGLSPEAQEDGIGFPAAQGTDGRFVHARDKESGHSPGAEAVGGGRRSWLSYVAVAGEKEYCPWWSMGLA
jgi:hypothetical protein